MNKFSSVFSQLLQLFPQGEFCRAVYETKSEKYAKGFASWQQFVAMLFCHLGQAHSLREICGGLATCLGKLKHLGVKSAPNRSTLSYANEHRPWQLFQQIFYHLLNKCQTLATGKKKFRFKNKLYSIDATLIELCASLFDWAKYCTTKGAIKLHLLLDHEGYLPVFAHITDGLTPEIKIARDLSFPSGSIIAMDRGYTDYTLFERWTSSGVYFVTRLKENTVFEVMEEHIVPQNSNIIKDQIIKLTGKRGLERCHHHLRLIEVWDEKNKDVVKILTNHLNFGATTIARIYKDRWQIEIFFKTIKQNLKIKTFVGTSSNALHIQIWTALIAILLLKYLKFRSRYNWSLSNLVVLLRLNLFTYRNLWDWINNPFDTPPIVPGAEQLALKLG